MSVTPLRRSLLNSILLGLVLLGGVIEEASAYRAISLNELGYSARLWSVDDGLPLNHISSISQSADGHLWIATRSGLARFNGTDFKTFRHSDIPGLKDPPPGDWFTSLHPDSKGRLWVGLIPFNLAVYEQGKFRLFGPDDGYIPGECANILEGKEGEIWALVDQPEGRRLLRYKDGRFEPSPLKPRQIVSSADGELWGITDEGVICINGEQAGALEKIEGTLPGEFWGGFQSRYGAPALGHPNGIYTRKNDNWTLSHPAIGSNPQSPIWSYPCESPDGFIWIPHHEQGLVVRTANGELRRVELPSLALSTSTYNLFCDREGSVWVC